MIPYKNRRLNPRKRVQVYRCLTRKGKFFSIRQSGLVIGHSETVTMVDAVFHVNEKGRQKVKRENKKYVHAWISGKIVSVYRMVEIIQDKNYSLPQVVKYNPCVTTHFVSKGKIINQANAVFISNGVVEAIQEIS